MSLIPSLLTIRVRHAKILFVLKYEVDRCEHMASKRKVRTCLVQFKHCASVSLCNSAESKVCSKSKNHLVCPQVHSDLSSCGLMSSGNQNNYIIKMKRMSAVLYRMIISYNAKNNTT